MTNQESEQSLVRFRALNVVKWLNGTPAIAVCTQCAQQFKVPLTALAKTALSKTADARINLQAQFDMHKCQKNEKIGSDSFSFLSR
jgi:hypothetical protein